MNIVEAEFATEVERFGGPFDVKVRADSTVDADVVALDQRGDFGQIAGVERNVAEHLAAGGSRGEEPDQVAAEVAETLTGAVCAGRRASETNGEAAGAFGIKREVGVGKIERGLAEAELEIDARVGEFDGGEEV